MSIAELRIELDEITRIFRSAKYYSLDFKYIHSVKMEYPIVHRTYYFFIERIFQSISVSLILELCKLFYKNENFSIYKLHNKMQEGYSNSELNRVCP